MTKFQKLRNALGPASWSLVSQLLSSLTNFITTFELAHQGSTQQFGATSLSLFFYTWTMTIVACMVNRPLMALFHRKETGTSNGELASQGLGAALLVSASCALVAFTVSIVFASGELRTYMMLLTVFLPLLLLHEWQRQWFFTLLRPMVPVALDLAWLTTMLILDTLILSIGHFETIYIYLAWLVSGSLISLIGLAIGQSTPSLKSGIRFMHNTRRMSARFIFDGLMSSSALLIIMAVTTAMIGLGKIAGIRGALTLLSPLIILNASADSFALPRFYRAYKARHAAFTEMLWMYSFTLIAVGLLYSAAVLAIPGSVGSYLLGASWEPTRSVLLPVCVFAVGRIFLAGPEAFLKIPEPGRELVFSRAADSILLIACALLGAMFGLQGAAWGLGLGKVSAVVPWIISSRGHSRIIRKEARI